MATLTPSQLYELTRRHFGDLGADVVETMYQIALAESGGNASAYNGQGMDNSHGLWQINTIAGANPDMLKYDLTDPEQNAMAAREIYDRAGPTAWSTYGGARTVGKPASPKQTSQAVLNSLVANPPELSDYRDDPREGKAAEQWRDAYDQWKVDVSDLQAIVAGYAEEEAGITRLEDGTIFHQDELDMLAQNDPAAYAQIQTYVANRNIERDNALNDILNQYDLSEFITTRQGVEMENDRLSKGLQNQLDSYRELIELDKANQNTVAMQIDRQLGGLSESRQRANVALDALLKAAPWGTSGGKSSFTPSDFGSIGEAMARVNGLPIDQTALQYTGTMNIDPNAMFNAYDQQLGVTGQLPQIPNLTTTAGMIPQAPGLSPIPQGSPVARRPQGSIPDAIPQASPPPAAPPLDPITAAIMDLMNGQEF